MTEVDSLHMVLLEFGDVGVYEASEDALGAELTLHQVIEREFATVKAPLLEVVDVARRERASSGPASPSSSSGSTRSSSRAASTS